MELPMALIDEILQFILIVLLLPLMLMLLQVPVKVILLLLPFTVMLVLLQLYAKSLPLSFIDRVAPASIPFDAGLEPPPSTVLPEDCA